MPQMAPAMWETIYIMSFTFTVMTMTKMFFTHKSFLKSIKWESKYTNMKIWLW